MGTTTRAMAHAKTAFICLALLAAAWAVTEVQELGNDDAHLDNHESANLSAEDDDSVGEAAGTGRRGGGGFLSTAGSFTLSSGGNLSGGQEEEDELGEGMGRRGGGGFLSTQGSFSLSSGAMYLVVRRRRTSRVKAGLCFTPTPLSLLHSSVIVYIMKVRALQECYTLRLRKLDLVFLVAFSVTFGPKFTS